MKTNIFAVNGTEDVNKCGLRDIGGSRAVGTYDVEDSLIRELDEDNMSPEQYIVNKFLSFLSDNRLSLDSLKRLPATEVRRLMKDFRQTIE